MKFKELLLLGGLVMIPQYTNEHLVKKDIQFNLLENLSQEVEKESESVVFYKFDLSQNLLDKLDSLDIYAGSSLIFSRSLEDLRDTPLFMR
jgi:hypothetical protein